MPHFEVLLALKNISRKNTLAYQEKKVQKFYNIDTTLRPMEAAASLALRRNALSYAFFIEKKR
jgi:hypothetical protein